MLDKNTSLSSDGKDGKQDLDTANLLDFDKQSSKKVSSTFTAETAPKQRTTSKNARSFAEAARHGVVDSDEEDDKDILEAVEGATPMTKRRVIKEENLKKVAKLGPMATAFTIFKSFVCTGILYMPKNYINSGWAFSGACIFGSLIVTLYCCKLLIEVSDKLKLTSFPEIGFKVFGKPGKIATDLVLFASQFGFVTAYVFFIAQQIGGPLGIIQCASATKGDELCSDGTLISKWWFVLICCVIWVPLVMVRKIEVFANFHVFGDILIIITILVIFAYAFYEVHVHGWVTEGHTAITPLWANAIGFSVYAFEGVGMILPVREVTENKDQYFTVMAATVIFIGVIYIAFPETCFFAFGAADITTPIITDSLPPQAWWTWVIKVLFSINLVISYPLIIHPANVVLESYLFGGWAKTRKRQMSKNISRTIIVIISCFIAIIVYDKLDKLLALTGAVTCTPIAFTFPALFHWRVCAESTCQQITDLSIAGVSIVIMIYCGYTSILSFSDTE